MGAEDGTISTLFTGGASVVQAAATGVLQLWQTLTVVATLVGYAVLVAAATAVMWTVVQYHDKGFEDAEHFHRTSIMPLWKDELRDFVDLARKTWNALICWFNGGVFFAKSYVLQVIYPTFRDCGVKPFLRALFEFVKVVAQDLVLYLVSGAWTTDTVSFSRIEPAGIVLSQEWIRLYTCSCSDLGDVIKLVPIPTPLVLFPPGWIIVLSSEQWTFPETWRAMENAINAAAAVAQQAFSLSSQLLNFVLGNFAPGQPFLRPDLRIATNFTVEAVRLAVRSTERAIQIIWDAYVPFALDWNMFLGALDEAFAVVLRTVVLVLHASLHVDRVVSYPGDPYLEEVIKPDLAEVLNLIAAPTNFADVQVPAAPAAPQFYLTSYYLDTNEPGTRSGRPNPVYQRARLEQGLCTLVTRIICDPSNSGGICFATNTQHLFFGFDFCCIIGDVGGGVVDLTSGAFEFVLQIFKGIDAFIFTIDAQPYTTIARNGIASLARCLLSVVTLIPAVGVALRDVLVAVIVAAASLADFAIRMGVGLATLPYYLIANPGVNNFVTQPNRALNAWETIFNDIVADTPQSVKNTLCVLVNSGFPIPPVPCGDCVVGGFIPPGPAKRSAPPPLERMFDPLTQRTLGPMDLWRREWGMEDDADGDVSQYHITPLLYYHNHTLHPFELFNRVWVNVRAMDGGSLPFVNLRDVDDFVDAKKRDMLLKWRETRRCNQQSHQRCHSQRYQSARLTKMSAVQT